MMRMRLLGMGLFGALLASLVIAAGASAGEYNLKTLPEIGRCKDVGGHSEFRGRKCTLSSPGTGRFEWFSGPGPKPGFSGTIKGGSQFTAAGAPGASLVCGTVEIHGEYTGPKNLKVTSLVFQGCHGPEGECQTGAGSTAGEIVAEELVGELGYISHPKKLKLGWDLKPASGSNLAKFECGGTIVGGKSLGGGASREVQGSVIGKIEPIDKMTSEPLLKQELAKKSTAQFPERFEGGVKDTLSMIVGEKPPGLGKSMHATTFVGVEKLKGEEPMEALGRCTGVGC
jgi:hypothetical protein